MSEASGPPRPSSNRLLRDLFELTKPRLSSLVIFTASAGMWLAPSPPTFARALGALVGITAVVGAANTLNNWIERDIDRHMTRTANRPLPTGRLSARTALIQGVVLTALSLPLLAWTANTITAVLGALSLFLYVAVYTPMKRRSTWSTIVGAIPGAMPPLMGWTTATGEIDAGGLVLFGILFFWQIPHFLAIGLFRKAEYANAGLIVMPNVQGDETTRRHITAYVTALLGVSMLAVPTGVGGMPTAIAAGLLGGTFWWKSVRGLFGEVSPGWARNLFFFSLIYLSVLFATMAVDRVV